MTDTDKHFIKEKIQTMQEHYKAFSPLTSVHSLNILRISIRLACEMGVWYHVFSGFTSTHNVLVLLLFNLHSIAEDIHVISKHKKSI